MTSPAPKTPGRQECPQYLNWVRTLPCLLHNQLTTSIGAYRCRGITQAAHVKSRGARGSDVGNVVPLCGFHHQQQHLIGVRSFQSLYELDLTAESERLARAYLRTEWPEF